MNGGSVRRSRELARPRPPRVVPSHRLHPGLMGGASGVKTPVNLASFAASTHLGDPMSEDRTTPFTIAGRVKHWDLMARRLTIGGRVLRVADSVRLVGLTDGANIVASGYQPQDLAAPWIVTQFTLY
jgi:hypothetical protein